MTGRRPAAAVLLAAQLALTACGVPTGGAPETIPATEVPAALTSTSPPGAPTDTAPPGLDQPRLFFVGAEEVLVPRGRDVAGATLADRLGALLDELAAGPTPTERGNQLATALPLDVRLSVADLSDGTATLAIAGDDDSPGGRDSRRAVAQLVLTATSLAGVERVLLTQDGSPVEAPLASGELTSRPLTAADYAEFLTAPPS
ncbi:GerMN domain-containing protein [Modestobacter sp. I12A-02662]|uniref:GerMN domain-containing protein n=1 Tax=Modestobacter sp. I12A-02662 TaxID=1730496 RepID=UPI0034E01BB8